MVSDTKTARVAIIDLGMGNLFSVKNACNIVGMEGLLTILPSDISSADAVILPGVGAFGDAMNTLNNLSLIPVLNDFIKSGKPFLGICLGMQLLMSYGTEFGYHKGLDIIKGHVEKIQNPRINNQKLKVPEIGWNQMFKNHFNPIDPWKGTPLQNLPDGVYMYFNHSYSVKPNSPEVSIATTHYGDWEFCSALKMENIIGIQSHPERSGKSGLLVYHNLFEMIEHYI